MFLSRERTLHYVPCIGRPLTYVHRNACVRSNEHIWALQRYIAAVAHLSPGTSESIIITWSKWIIRVGCFKLRCCESGGLRGQSPSHWAGLESALVPPTPVYNQKSTLSTYISRSKVSDRRIRLGTPFIQTPYSMYFLLLCDFEDERVFYCAWSLLKSIVLCISSQS